MLAWWTGWASSPASTGHLGASKDNCVSSRWEKGVWSSLGSPVKGRPWCAKFSGRWLVQWQKMRSWDISALRRWRGFYIAVCGYMMEIGYREGKRYKLLHPVPRCAFVYCWLLLQQVFDTMGKIKALLHRDKAKEMQTLFFCTSITAWCLFCSRQSSLNPTASEQLSAFLLSPLTYPFFERELIPICIQGDSLLTRLQWDPSGFVLCLSWG